MLIDLHAHSHLSKGCELDPRAVLERAAMFGLDGVAFTETNTQDGCDELFEIGAKAKVKVFVGLELVTDRGQYLCFFPKPELAPEPVQMWGSNREKPWSAAECLPKVKALGAAIVAARPFDRDSPNPAMDYVRSLNVLCAVEGYNARVKQTSNDLAVEAAEALKLPCTGGSDARGSLDEVGRGATFFKNPVTSQAQLIAELLKGEFWPVMAGELPRLTRPGEAQAARKQGGGGGGKRRRGGGGGRR
ncbi:PHP domain-containing protein [Myxococcus sp. MISCRS1]|uniref:PHP-associated domain-containing protein n=1 Tax=Myxococcus TaxID=32 RepID=UPI001CBE5650|nr:MULTISPECIES: PHP domain-containing protein [unclassified Myxococcus]MBZ4397511.1 PHP domain-containing protein [Myxococcus sp. AS-1-15]MBZ4411141.1 PHP domain-containing protein [Myxococcus sp. XM-1-1-1]MCY1003640.1 PHP domain-containing protein [Myxococcus sp. MISCRS1]BDT34751.1 PHP domain-containing protein [Myxococcus sp. MH1]